MRNDLSTDLRTIRISALCSDGAIRDLVLEDEDLRVVIAILSRVYRGEVHAASRNVRAGKQVSIKRGIRMDLAALAVDGFLREVDSGVSGPHIGPRNGVAFAMDVCDTPGQPEEKRTVFLYVYQTATQIVVSM